MVHLAGETLAGLTLCRVLGFSGASDVEILWVLDQKREGCRAGNVARLGECLPNMHEALTMAQRSIDHRPSSWEVKARGSETQGHP